MNTTCQKCGKPVYFAERKTSLGKNWHPNCLRCDECNKVLNPGQHSEHKGKPYCTRPCYAILYGPQMMGYGSNVVSPANFRKNEDRTLVNGGYDFELIKVYESDSPSAKESRKNSGGTPRSRSSTGDIPNPRVNAGSKINNQERVKSFVEVPQNGATSNNSRIFHKPEEQELLKNIQSFNNFYEGKTRQSLSVKQDTDDFVIVGPLRIYWGIVKPIRLQQFDNVPSVPSANWRHSFVPGDTVPDFTPDFKELQSPTETSSPTTKLNRGYDDSVIFTPPEGVVMRKKNIKKFNTVSYKGDSRPNKWKRASINGHIYNFDTRVFTPVLGSCTGVTVESTYKTYQVIKTLLDKFKVENEPEEYSLYLVSDKEGERILRDNDLPLLERIALGPDEVSGAKLFLRDRVDQPRKQSLVTLPVQEEVEEEEPKVEESLPGEVEQLVALPEPVLRGILLKFREDEEKEVRIVKARYDLVRKRIEKSMALHETQI